MFRFIMALLGKEYEPCKSCETLKEELEIQRSLYQNLTNTIIAGFNTRNNVQEVPQYVPSEPIVRKNWNQKRRELEEDSRQRAAELRARINEAEKEVGIENASKK